MINFIAAVGFFVLPFSSSFFPLTNVHLITKHIGGVLRAPRTFLYVYLIGFCNITHANVHIESVTISVHPICISILVVIHFGYKYSTHIEDISSIFSIVKCANDVNSVYP